MTTPTLQYMVDCDSMDSLPNVGFEMGGKVFELTPDQYIMEVHMSHDLL